MNQAEAQYSHQSVIAGRAKKQQRQQHLTRYKSLQKPVVLYNLSVHIAEINTFVNHFRHAERYNNFKSRFKYGQKIASTELFYIHAGSEPVF